MCGVGDPCCCSADVVGIPAGDGVVVVVLVVLVGCVAVFPGCVGLVLVVLEVAAAAATTAAAATAVDGFSTHHQRCPSPHALL